MIRFNAIIFTCLVVFACQPKKESAKRPKDDGNVKRSYSKDGKLLSEISMINGLREGLGKTYYSNGKVSFEINYKAGKRDGVSKRYYETGILFQETEYKDDKKNGFEKKYWEDGKLLSEAHYTDNFVCKGLKEFLSDGVPKKDYPSLIITPVDHLRDQGVFYLNLSLTNKSKRVKYYVGRLSQGGCITGALEPVYFNVEKNIGQVRYDLSPGQFRMQEVHIIAAVETPNGNTQIIEGNYNLAIEN